MDKYEKMFLPSEAMGIIARYGKPGETEDVPLLKAPGRVLAEDLISGIEMPPFDKSAMDGFAVISGDNSEKFRIVATIPAGKFPRKKISMGECARIMTGAPLPAGAGRVIRVEVTEETDGFMVLTGEDPALNVCTRGEDIRIGDRILEKGRMMDAAAIGAAASLGLPRLNVYRRVRAGLIATGSEIRDPGKRLSPGQIYNSNGYSLSVQLSVAGAEVIGQKIVSDERNDLVNELGRMIGEADLTVITGGVSMGEFDLVPDVLEELGVTIHFNKVAVQPGKPTLFGTKGEKIIFGLPGNPVSAFVIFEIFVKPLLTRMAGGFYRPLTVRGKLAQGFRRKKGERDLYVPVHYDNGTVKLIEYHGSAHFVSLLGANGLLKVDRGVFEIPGGRMVNVRQI